MINLFYKVFIALAILIILIPGVSAHTTTASNTIQYQDNTIITTFEQSYVYGKQITMLENYEGSMRVCFDMAGGYDVDADVITPGYAKIYLNGVAYGAEKVNNANTYSTYCDDYNNLNLQAGTDIQVYYHGSQWFEASISNFKVKFDITGAPQTPTLGLVSDTFTSVQHSISLCRPYPVEYYDFNTVPATHSCNDTQIFYLDQYPLNSLPSGGQSHRISDGEMLFVYASVNDYPGTGYINTSYYNKDTNTLLFSFNQDLTECAGNCGWTYWSWFVYSYIGHFGWEINSPGYYNASVKTPWGEHVYNFEVREESPFSIKSMYLMDLGAKIEADIYTNGTGTYEITLDGSVYQDVMASGFNHLTITNITTTQGVHNVCAYSIANPSIETCQSVYVSGIAPTPTPAPQNTSITYNVGALINDANLDVHACSGINRGFFYMTAPLNSTQHRYGTYVNEYSCSDFSIPISDMIASGGSGIWTLSIFDESDMSTSKAMFQVNITESVTLLFTSNPSGANVYINSSLKGTTPFNYNPGNQTDFHLKFSKEGYVDAIFNAHYTISNTVNVNLVPLQNTTTPGPTSSPGTPTNTDNVLAKPMNDLWSMIDGFLSMLGDGVRIVLSVIIIGICAIACRGDKNHADMSSLGAIVGFILVSAIGLLPTVWVIIGIVAIIAMFYLGGKRNDKQ